jgi:hypothetical protein
VFTGNGEPGVSELKRPRRRTDVGADTANCGERPGVALTRRAQQVLRALVLLFEIQGEQTGSVWTRTTSFARR